MRRSGYPWSPMNTRRIFPILAALMSTAAFLVGCNTTSEVSVDKTRIAPEKVREWVSRNPDRYLIVDARPEAAFRAGHLPNAIRMDPRDVDPLDPDPKFSRYKGVIVYGDDPAYGRANGLTKRMIEAGIKVSMIDGGLHAWRQRGYPVESAE